MFRRPENSTFIAKVWVRADGAVHERCARLDRLISVSLIRAKVAVNGRPIVNRMSTPRANGAVNERFLPAKHGACPPFSSIVDLLGQWSDKGEGGCVYRSVR